MAYTVGVRSELMKRDPSLKYDDITYDAPTSTVNVRGQSFMRPERNYGGSTYTTPESFNTAYSSYKGSQPNTGVTTQPVNTSQYGAPVGEFTRGTQDNAYGNDPYKYMMGQIAQRETTPGPSFDPYSSAAYKAAEARTQQQAHQGIRAAQESMGASGFSRSSALAERAQGIQNDANQYLMTQVAPQIEAQEMARRQQEYQNLLAGVQPFQQQQARDIQQNQFGQEFALREGEALGSYMRPEMQQGINQMNANSAAWFNATPEEQQRLAYENQELGRSIGATQDQQGNWVMPQGTPTMGNRQFQQGVNERADAVKYQQLRDSIADAKYVQTFDEDVRRFGLNFAADQAYKARQLSLEGARLALSGQGQAASQSNANASKLFEIWDRTGRAPQGLEGYGIQAGTPLKGKTPASDGMFKSVADAANYFEGSPGIFAVDAVTGKPDYSKVTNPSQLEQMILESGLSPAEMTQLYRRYGIPLQ